MGDKKNYGVLVFISIICVACYGIIGYEIPRTNFAVLLVLVTVLFILYMLMTAKDFARLYFKQLLVLALFFRLIFLFTLPALSDDYFRFAWDGALTSSGVNPYLYTPATVNAWHGTTLPAYLNQLKAGMNSLPYFSPYPPVLQLMFFTMAKLGGYNLFGNVIVLRAFALLADAGIIFITIKILAHFKLARQRVFLYALNPLVIIELTGNLHGEVVMIFFMLLSFYLLLKNNFFFSAVVLGLAVSTKLLPLIFLPAIISFLGSRKGIAYGTIMLATAAVSFLPFLNAVFIGHIGQSVGFYFQKFEFNASIYYVLRWVGYDVTGFNLIYFIGRALPVLAFVSIAGIAIYKNINTARQLIERLLFSLLVYYLFSLIVHPWYITVLVILSVFTRYRFAFVWSALIMLTYSTYLQKPYHEILWLTAVEYIILGAVLYFEIKERSIKEN